MSNTVEPKSNLDTSEAFEVTEVDQEQEDLELSDEQLEPIAGGGPKSPLAPENP